MRAVHVDTHVLVWLDEANQTRLAPLQRHLEGQRLVASPIAVLELQYLYEIGRIRRSDEAILDNLGTTLGLDGLGGDSETLALAKTTDGRVATTRRSRTTPSSPLLALGRFP